MDECTDYKCAYAAACRKNANIISTEAMEEVAGIVATKKYEDIKRGGYGLPFKNGLRGNPEKLKEAVHQIQEKEGSEKCFVL